GPSRSPRPRIRLRPDRWPPPPSPGTAGASVSRTAPFRPPALENGTCQAQRMPHEVVLVRHGETDWSAHNRHTGRTDVPLTEDGRHEAERVGRALRGRSFALVLTSPLKRAAETCWLTGYGELAQARPDLME